MDRWRGFRRRSRGRRMGRWRRERAGSTSRFAALGAAGVGRGGAEVVAAVVAEAGAIAAARAEGGAEFERGERGEEEGDEPVGGDVAIAAGWRRDVAVAEAEE